MRWVRLGFSACLAIATTASICAGQGLPASGQKKCWDSAGAKVVCAGTGQDGDIRAGMPLNLVDAGNGSIQDGTSGLTWEKLSRDGGVHDLEAVFTWDEAFAKLAELNTVPCFAGYCDWRVPNVKELQGLVDYQRKAPALPRVFSKQCRPGCTVLDCSCTPKTTAGAAIGFWSSTTNLSLRSEAWQLVHATGGTQSVAKSASGSMRAVRGGIACTRAIATVITSYSAGGSSVSGVTIDLDYPEAKLAIPGVGSGADVAERIQNTSGVSGLFQVSDTDSVAGAGLVNLSQAIPPGIFVEIAMDCVPGEPSPTLADFACTATASDFLGLDVPATCSISLDLD